MIKNVAAVLGNEQVGKSVVVIIAPDTAQAVTCTGNAGLFGDIGESAIAVVSIERIADGDAAVVQVAAIDEVNVLPAVAVKVSDADSGTKFFPVDGDAVIALEVREFDSGRSGNVCELNRRWWRLRTRRRTTKTKKYPEKKKQRQSTSRRVLSAVSSHETEDSISAILSMRG